MKYLLHKATIHLLSTSFVVISLFLPENIIAKEQKSLPSSEKKILITGSRIKVDMNELSPILSISREDIDKQGYATVKDVIDGLTQNTGGTIDSTFTFGFTPGASSVNLRGIGFGHTLILIDGRRLPIYPVGIGGTNNFVDLSAIPMAFVERIDVLIDGASAIYGSDAVSGVINIITQKDIEGISMNYRYGNTSDGGYENHRYNLMTGARNGDTQLDLIVDLWSQNAIWATQRDYAASDVSNPRGTYSFGGVSFLGLDTGTVYQHPECGTNNDSLGGASVADVEFNLFNSDKRWCGFNRSPYRQLIAPQDRFSLMTRLTYEITPELSFFSRIGYSYSDLKVQSEPNLYSGFLLNGFGSAVPNFGGVVLSDAINNPTTGSGLEETGLFVRRLVEFGARKTEFINHSINLLAGLEGSFVDGKYDWDLGISYNRTNLEQDSNDILLSGLNFAVENGLNLFQTIPQNVVNSLAYNANRDSFSSNRVIDFSISGDLPFGFESGPVKFAVALELVTEKYKDIPDPLVAQGDSFDGVSSGKGERKHTGIGTEFSFPFTDNFELDLAFRWDEYDDVSSVNGAVSPKIAFRYQPFSHLFTHISWGKSFRAPDMQRLFGDKTRSFIDVVDPELLVDSSGNLCTINSTCSPVLVQSVNFNILSNINLSEEKGTNLTLGTTWQVTDNFSVTVDYFEINIDDVVTTLSAQSLINFCSFSNLFCDSIKRDNTGSLFGSEAYIEAQAINFIEWNTQGIDVVFNYDWENNSGKWSTTLSITKVDKFETRFAPEFNRIENVALGTLPEYRANMLFDWQLKNWGVTARLNYVDKIAGNFCNLCTNDEYIDSWLTSNINLRYAYSSYIRLNLGINNLFNKAPPEDPSQTLWPWYRNAGGYYSAVGRELYFQVEANF